MERRIAQAVKVSLWAIRIHILETIFHAEELHRDLARHRGCVGRPRERRSRYAVHDPPAIRGERQGADRHAKTQSD
ncbi:hypothetical protein D3C87_1900830 [compost metagenome]